MEDDQLISTKEALIILQVGLSTFQRWKKAGYIKEVARNPRLKRSHQARYNRDEIEHFMPPMDDTSVSESGE